MPEPPAQAHERRARSRSGTAADSPGPLLRHCRGRPGGLGPRAGSGARPFRLPRSGRHSERCRPLSGCVALRSLPRPVGFGPRSTVERRWWAGTVPSPPVCAGPSSSGTAFTSTARDGVTPTSRTGCENVSVGPTPRASRPRPLPAGRAARAAARAAEGRAAASSEPEGGAGAPRAPRAAPGPGPCDIPPFWRSDFPILFPHFRRVNCTRWSFDLRRVCLLQGGVSGLFFFLRSPFKTSILRWKVVFCTFYEFA